MKQKIIFLSFTQLTDRISRDWYIDFLLEKERKIAQHYTKRFIDYISFNQDLFPEYNSNSNGDMYPDTNNNFIGWVL